MGNLYRKIKLLPVCNNYA